MSDLSDHYAPFNLIRSKSAEIPEVTTLTFRDFDHSDPDTVRTTVGNMVSEVQFGEDNVDELYDKLSTLLETATDVCYPVKTKRIPNKSKFKPWLSREILEQIKKRHKLYKNILQ